VCCVLQAKKKGRRNAHFIHSVNVHKEEEEEFRHLSSTKNDVFAATNAQ